MQPNEKWSLTEDFLYRACPEPDDPDCRRKSAILSLATGLGLLLYISFLPSLLRTDKELLAGIAVAAGLLHGVNLIIARRTRRLDACTAFAVLLLGGFLCAIIVFGGVEQTGLMWSFLFPPIPLFAQGHRKGKWVSFGFLLAVAVLLLSPGEALLATSYPLALKIRFLVILFFVSAITYLFERARDTAARRAKREIEARIQTERELRRAKEEAERFSAAKGEFLATMSHELRAPMNGVVGTIHLMLAGPLNDDQRRLAVSARRSAENLLEVVDDILDLSRIERGMLTLERSPFDLTRLVAEVVETFAPQAQDAELALTCEIDKRLPPLLIGDALRVRQVLTNLVGNAMKFTERGGVHIVAEAAEIDPRGIRVRMAVQDTGMGVPADRQEQIFALFTQADPATARKYGGSGLGLAICRQLVELMGGQIGLQSDGESGSTFWFEVLFPFAAADRDR